MLDTNVVSEPLRSGGDPAIAAWLDRQAAETLYLTATSLSELLLGLQLLPGGKRKSALRSALHELLDRLFGPRVLPFDAAAAAVYATVLARASARGKAIGVSNSQIAAIAVAHGYIVATRDTAPFLAADVAVVNPWSS